jgi:hypothetical protein
MGARISDHWLGAPSRAFRLTGPGKIDRFHEPFHVCSGPELRMSASRVPPALFGPAGAGLLVLLGLGCSPEYALLETVGGASSGGGPSADGVAGSPVAGTSAMGGTGTAAGGTGTAVGGTASSAGTSVGGGSAGATSTPCAMHGECAVGTLCRDNRCLECAQLADTCADPCDHGFRRFHVIRNGCDTCECVPPSECTISTDCANGEVCYAGTHCADGCNDPTCCSGNQCSPAGCGAAPAACLAFGCSAGGQCLAACEATTCECDGVSWICGSTTGGTAVASCPQACASP